MTKYLFSPGPVPLDPAVQAANAGPVISHRSREFPALLLRLQNRLRDLLRTSGPVPVFPGSGTAALEALAVNFTGPGTTVISFSCGVFGERFREIARRSGAEVVSFDIEPGKPCLPEDVRDACMIHPDADVLLLTHNETSTGVCNPPGPAEGAAAGTRGCSELPGGRAALPRKVGCGRHCVVLPKRPYGAARAGYLLVVATGA